MEHFEHLNRFAILQLSEAETLDRNKRFAQYSDDNEYTADDYEISYFKIEEPDKKVNLDQLYSQFNGVQPPNYYGHNLSVSDVILESYNGKISAYYVDRFGFKELDDSFLTEKIIKRFELGLDVRKELKGLNNNASELKANLEADYNVTERRNYLEENYYIIFQLAEMRNRYEIGTSIAEDIDNFLNMEYQTEYMDSIISREEAIAQNRQLIFNGNFKGVIDNIQSIVPSSERDNQEYENIIEKLQSLDVRYNSAIAELVAKYETLEESTESKEITEWIEEEEIFAFKNDVSSEDIQSKVDKVLALNGYTLQEFLDESNSFNIDLTEIMQERELEENLKKVMESNQDKLKVIYENEKDLPFQSVSLENGIYILDSSYYSDLSDLQENIDRIYKENTTYFEKLAVINEESKNITVIPPLGNEYTDTFYVIDKAEYNGTELFLLESEEYGDERPCVIVDKYNNVVLENVHNGFDDFLEQREDFVLKFPLEKPIRFKDEQGNFINITEHYVISLPSDLKFIDQNNNQIEYMLGTINVSDMKLFVKTENNDLLYSGKLDNEYTDFAYNLSDTLDTNKYAFKRIANLDKLQQNEEYTVFFRYDEEKIINGWRKLVDSVTFDDYDTAMKYTNNHSHKQEVVYDYLDNAIEIRTDETPIYMINDNGKVIWENERYQMDFIDDIKEGKLSSSEIMEQIYTLQGTEFINELKIKVLGEILEAKDLNRVPYEDGTIHYSIGNVEFRDYDLEAIEYKGEIMNNDLSMRYNSKIIELVMDYEERYDEEYKNRIVEFNIKKDDFIFRDGVSKEEIQKKVDKALELKGYTLQEFLNSDFKFDLDEIIKYRNIQTLEKLNDDLKKVLNESQHKLIDIYNYERNYGKYYNVTFVDGITNSGYSYVLSDMLDNDLQYDNAIDLQKAIDDMYKEALNNPEMVMMMYENQKKLSIVYTLEKQQNNAGRSVLRDIEKNIYVFDKRLYDGSASDLQEQIDNTYNEIYGDVKRITSENQDKLKYIYDYERYYINMPAGAGSVQIINGVYSFNKEFYDGTAFDLQKSIDFMYDDFYDKTTEIVINNQDKLKFIYNFSSEDIGIKSKLHFYGEGIFYNLDEKFPSNDVLNLQNTIDTMYEQIYAGFIEDIKNDKISSAEIIEQIYSSRETEIFNDVKVKVYGETLDVRNITRESIFGRFYYRIGHFQFETSDIEAIEYKGEIIKNDLQYQSIGTVETELLQEGEFGFSNEELKKIVEGIKNGNTFIKLNELNSKFNDDVIIRLGKEDITYDNDRECYAWFRDFDPEIETAYYTYFDIEDVKGIYIGEEEIRNYYSESEKAQLRKNKGIQDVAVESTEDYTDTSFHKDLIDIDIKNDDGTYGKEVDYYRLVTIGEKGLLVPLDDKVYSNVAEARASIDTSKFYELGYDDIVYRAGIEIQRYELQMQENNKLLDVYEEKGFSFPHREEYSDKYLDNLYNAIKQAESKGYGDKAIVEYAKAKARFIDVEKAVNSIPLIKNADMVAKIEGIEFYVKKDNPNYIYTYDGEFPIEGMDIEKACENIFEKNYKDIFIYSELMQSAEYGARIYDDEEIIEAIQKEAGIIEFDKLAEKDYVVLDTETTGFGKEDEVIEIGIIDKNGNLLYESQFKPNIEISEEASAVNGITNKELADKPSFVSELEKIANIIQDKDIVIYNKAFDSRMILQTAELHKDEFGSNEHYNAIISKLENSFNNRTYCAMQSYVNFTDNYKTVSLNNALKENGIDVVQSHRAVDDCKDVLSLLQACITVERENEREVTHAEGKNDIGIAPVQEFVKDGKIYTGSEVSGFHIDRNDGVGFSDRSRLYKAVFDFQEANKNFPNLPTAIDENGNYEDKEFLYAVYDEYVALSHREELKEYEQYFDDYVDNKIAYFKEHDFSGSDDRYINKLDVLAEVYYAKQSGLSKDDITYMIDNAKGLDYYLVADNMRRTWQAFSNGLTREQIDLAKEFNSSDRDIILSMIADGGTVEQINTLKGFNYNVLYSMSSAYTNNYITTEQGQALCGGLRKCFDSGKLNNDYFIGHFIDGVVIALRNEPKSATTITTTFDEFINQEKYINFFEFIKENGWIDKDNVNEKDVVVEDKSTLQEEKIEEATSTLQDEKTENITASLVDEETAENNKYGLTQEELNEKQKLELKLKEGIKSTLDSENFARWCEQQGKLYYNGYSAKNAFLTYIQKPEASYVCGYDSWQDYGRQVAKGAKGIKIFSPVHIDEEKKGELYGLIKNTCKKQIREGSDYAKFHLMGTKIDIYMQKNGLFDVKTGDKTHLSHATEEQFKKFLDRNIIGKVPKYYNVVTVFDIKDTIVPETLWVKKGNFKKNELVLDKNGEPVKRYVFKEGKDGKKIKVELYKIYNTDERKNRLNVNLDMTVKTDDKEKLELLYDTLKEVSKNKGIPLTESDPSKDETLREGARGYFKHPTKTYPNGNIVISSELPLANKISTAFHELAHADLHTDLDKLKTEMELGKDVKITRQIKEIQAEAVSFMTASNFGIETDHKTFNYIATWSDSRDLKALEDSMKVIYNESKKLMKDIEKVLDSKGLDLSLSEKRIESYNSVKEGVNTERITLADEYIDLALNGLRKNEAIQKEAFNSLKKTDNEQLKAIIKEQIFVTSKAEEKYNELYSKAVKFKNCEDSKSSVNLDLQLKSLKSQIEQLNVSLDKLSEEHLEVTLKSVEKNNDLKALFSVDPQKTFEILAESYPALKDLPKNDMKFLVNNDFIKSEYSKLLGVNNEKFVELATKHLNDFKEVMSKNNTVVEISWCEQWTDKPIFNKDKGYLLHPALANKVIGNAEKQIGELKKEAEKNDEYFPYSKCKLSVHSITELNGKPTLSTLNLRIDIGDGSQKDLKDHLEQILSDSRSKAKQQILTNFEKSVNERTDLKSIEAVYHSELLGQYSDERKFDGLEPLEDISQSMADWKREMGANSNSNIHNLEKTNEKSKSKDTNEKE